MRIKKMLFFALLIATTISCSKENDKEESKKTPEELLTANAWKPNELRAIQNNDAHYYKRGSVVTPNFNLDNESVEFETNNTGVYIGTDGVARPITWNFTNTEKTKLTWVIQSTPALTINWEITDLREGFLRYDEYYIRGTWNTMTFGHRIPK